MSSDLLLPGDPLVRDNFKYKKARIYSFKPRKNTRENLINEYWN